MRERKRQWIETVSESGGERPERQRERGREGGREGRSWMVGSALAYLWLVSDNNTTVSPAQWRSVAVAGRGVVSGVERSGAALS